MTKSLLTFLLTSILTTIAFGQAEKEEIEKLETLEGIAFIENVKKLKGCEYFSESPSKLDQRA